MYICVILLVHLVLATLPHSSPNENKYVKVDVRLAGSTARAGGEGRILATFTPAEGIHINTDPRIRVRLDRNRAFTLHGDPDMSTDKESGFLETSTPVEQRFVVSSKAKPGEYTLRGTIVYYFCSDAEGWCTRFTQPIALKLNIEMR